MKSFLQIFLAVAVVILLMAAGAFFFWTYQQKTVKSVNPVQLVTPSPEITKADVSPIIIETTLAPTASASPTPQASDMDLLKSAMAAKHNRPATDVELTIGKNTGSHASGGVSFAGEMGGGWWLGAKTADGWVIVQDGNGTIDCAVIAPYNFPTSIVAECYDQATEQIVKR